MFNEDLSAYFAAELADEVAASTAPPPNPLPCDAWIARSCLQKAIRRADAHVALRALATLLQTAPGRPWKALVVIALEDIGVVGIDLLAKVVVAARSKYVRESLGGDWRVAAELVQQMAASPHCQAACDLLMRATNDPAHERDRIDALDSDFGTRIEQLADVALDPRRRACFALSIAGEVGAGQDTAQPTAVFQRLADVGRCSLVVATSEAAWRVCRNPMALLLPLLWPDWMDVRDARLVDDSIPAGAVIGEVPSYSVDQFTRSGLRVLRAFVSREPSLQTLLAAAGVPPMDWYRTVGDLLFLAEGSALCSRVAWPLANDLRKPQRPLVGVFRLGELALEALEIVAARRALFDDLRREYISPMT